MHAAITELAPMTGVAEACRMLAVPRSTYYRREFSPTASGPLQPGASGRVTRRSPRALSAEEQAHIRAVLNSERFADCAPREIYATFTPRVPDEGQYLCSWSTMYRILREADEVRRRRDHRRQGASTKPELLATRPNQLWSWDITKLKGPTTWSYYYLYVILDVYSRYVVGWMIAERETAALAEACIAETCAKEGIGPDQLTLHADRGSAMTSKCVAHLLADLGVTKTHSRPQVSNDNPFSEAQFKTVKYHPATPERFGSVEDARAWARTLFQWYNQAHHHTGIGLLTPATVHHGRAPAVLAAREAVLLTAYATHPERFVRGAPRPAALPTAVWINPPLEGGTPTPTLSAAQAEPTMLEVPPVVPVSSGDTAQRPLDTGTRGATLRPTCAPCSGRLVCRSLHSNPICLMQLDTFRAHLTVRASRLFFA
jgi:putative transposase